MNPLKTYADSRLTHHDVTITFRLTEEGQRDALQRGFDGRAYQTCTISLHRDDLDLVRIDAEGQLVANISVRCFTPAYGNQPSMTKEDYSFDHWPSVEEIVNRLKQWKEEGVQPGFVNS